MHSRLSPRQKINAQRCLPSRVTPRLRRAGIQSIDRGQWEAARAIGLSRFNVLRDIILPQAIKKILPPLAGQFITLVKDSSIVSLISIQELTFLTQEVANTTTQFFEAWLLTGFLYFIVCYPLALLFGRLERKLKTSPSG